MPIQLPDLDNRSVLDIIKINFQNVGLKTYAERLIYIGEHNLPKEEVIRKFQKSINYVNQGYTDIPVNGILLVYDSYFVHVLEGSEDTVHRQIRYLFNIEQSWVNKMKKRKEEAAATRAAEVMELAQQMIQSGKLPPETEPEPEETKPEPVIFKRTKTLMVYHSITTLTFSNWRAIIAHPPSLVAKLDLHAPLSEHMQQLRICLDKISKLCKLAQEQDELSFAGLSANDPKMEALPEVVLLDYLLQSPYTMDLKETAALHRRVDDFLFYFERVWPLKSAFTPKHLYKLKIDDSFVEPLPIMPWEMKKEDEEGEGEAAPSKDSSSD